MRALARWAQRSSTGCCADDAGVRSSDDPPAAALWSAWPHTPSTAIAGRFDLRGPALAPVAACATGVVCVNRGAELVRDGTCDVVLAGSSDASLVPAVLASFDRLQILARRPDDPAGACRPFDRDRNGFLIGEGAAALVLEDWDLAAGRGVPIYAEWVGGRQLSDPTGLTALAPDAAPLTRLLQDLLSGAGLTPRDVHYINLHGTGTRTNDRCESLALRRLCGGDAPPWLCGSLKGNLGHLLGAAGSVELAATALALREGVVPPHVNLEHPDPACQPGLLPLTATRRQLRHAVKLSLGFGGHLAATLLRAPQ
jgi:3-oxoacyl-[acyl-carrier-protein] synthase II